MTLEATIEANTQAVRDMANLLTRIIEQDKSPILVEANEVMDPERKAALEAEFEVKTNADIEKEKANEKAKSETKTKTPAKSKAKPKTEEKPKPKAEEPAEQQPAEISLELLSNAITNLAQTKGREAARGLVDEYKVARASLIPKDKWHEVITKANKLAEAE